MAMIGDRNSLAAIHRIKGIKEETVMKWLEKASTHVKQFERIVRKKKLSCVQLDALWTYVWHKGEKGGDLKRCKRHFLDWKSHRHGEPPASGLCNRQNGGRNRSRADETSKNACTGRRSTSNVK